MKKILLLLGILFVSVTGFSETLTGNFVPKIHQINGSITADTNEKEIILSNYFISQRILEIYKNNKKSSIIEISSFFSENNIFSIAFGISCKSSMFSNFFITLFK